jgi:hypothetical protein
VPIYLPKHTNECCVHVKTPIRNVGLGISQNTFTRNTVSIFLETLSLMEYCQCISQGSVPIIPVSTF